LESQWSLLKEVKATNNNHIEALADVPVDSPWFSGHFPGEPILPGIALIHLVKQAIVQESLKKGELLKLNKLRRVRFINPVWPGETVSVSITAEDSDEDVLFSFKVLKKENVVCSGLIAAKKVKE
jgi:3-hydroxymyristoyl/3-hydroxydecanoyl-(acyl carrier protein) dehydratase